MKQDNTGQKVTSTRVTYEQYCDCDFAPPSNFYIKTAMGDFLFFHTRDRKKAQEGSDDYSGKVGMYKVNSYNLQRTTKSYTARG